MTFFPAFATMADEKPVIVYVDESFREHQQKDVQRELDLVATLTKTVDYAIAFVWRDKSDVMVDLWLFSKLDSWGSGPLADVQVFRNGKTEVGSGVASGNTLLVLGIEEAYRRKTSDFYDYISGERPEIPEELRVNHD